MSATGTRDPGQLNRNAANGLSNAWRAGLCGLCICICLGSTRVNAADPCVLPDNGNGTVTLPPQGCDYLSPQEVHMIIDGLPPGTTIELEAIHMDFICGDQPDPFCSIPLPPGECEGPGGVLGGDGDCFESVLDLTVRGTGMLAGFNRHLFIPVFTEVHTGPRNPGDPVQVFPNEMMLLMGELFGDPDFCTFRVMGGMELGLPSPGLTTLTDLGGGLYNVDSFFDVSYMIDFEGCPGSILEGFAGTTMAMIRMATGTEPPCAPTADGTACQPGDCADATDTCHASCLNYDPQTGESTVIACECRGPSECHAEPAPPPPTDPCIQPDDGSGTVTLPPIGCEYISPDEVHLIIDGLPPGTTIELDPIHMDFVCTGPFNPICSMPLMPGQCETLGGSLGGHGDCFESALDMTVRGTGMLEGFNRHLFIPVYSEVHTGPRNPGDPVQTFPNDMYRLQGELFGDPDFCTFRVTAGTDFGLPSPGQTTVTDIGGGLYHIDSFFDVVYMMEFEGCPGSILDGFAGMTMAVIRMETGSLPSPPTCVGDCAPGERCEESQTVHPDGTIDICCNCVSDVCEPNADGTACNPQTCPVAGEACQERCMQLSVATGETTLIECECRESGSCHIEAPPPSDPCVVPDNGTGTVTLPPIGCDYIGPDEVHEIIDGLPPGTTIELDPIHMDFICTGQSGLCSMPLGPGECETLGGSLGGHGDCFESTLDLTVRGTGELAGFNRHLAVPVASEIHTGPRNPGDPVQAFATDMYRLQGELFGDPDFCTFRVFGGTDFGLPSPGETTVTDIGGGLYQVDSFFDVTYMIEFEGCPGSQLDGYAGMTMATIRMQTETAQPPTCAGDCPLGSVCEQSETVNPDGTIDYCCDCVQAPCEPTPDGSQCQPAQECTDISQSCEAHCAHVDLTNGATTMTDCECRDQDACYVEPPPPGQDNPCIVSDNGNGTVTLPPAGCEYLSPNEVHEIIDGLPPGTTIELDASHRDFFNVNTSPGGSLGGEIETFDSTLRLNVSGTGLLQGFNRSLWVPVVSVVHTGPRNPGDPVQTFANDMFMLQGQLFGDPDFCELRVLGGTNFGLPSPGQTTLTNLGDGTFHVDSFFDVAYQIEFEGCPGSQLDGYMGTTMAMIRMATGTDLPTCAGTCPDGFVCDQTITGNGDGTIETCCDCVADVCAPRPDGMGCNAFGCPIGGEACEQKCMQLDLATGQTTVVECDCSDPSQCHVEAPPAPSDPCVVPDNGTGTATLPPIGCEYIGPDEVHEIIDGLPPGTTIELDPIHMDFICGPSALCSMPLAPGQCETEGGSLGGHGDCFESTLDLTVSGTGELAGFHRHLAIPVASEVHTGPRNPGDPVQTFDTDMFRLQGELFGDPDFCTFRVIGGTDFGLPSPGQTTLVQLPGGNFAVDSFFDVAFQIEFEGCPGSQLDGFAGTTMATIRMKTGVDAPVCVADCPPDFDCERSLTNNPDGTVDYCCNCVPAPPDVNPPLPEDSLGVACTQDLHCENTSVCLGGRCYLHRNRYISIEPNNPGRLVRLKVTLADSLVRPCAADASWWVQAPVNDPDRPKPAMIPGECLALLGPEASAAEIDWDAAGCQRLHITGCPIIPSSNYSVQAVVGSGASSVLTLPTALRPGNVKWWGDTVGVFNGTRWTPPQGTTNIDDVNAGIKTFQVGSLPPPGPEGNGAHLSVADVHAGNINSIVNGNDYFLVIKAFQGQPYPFGAADANGLCFDDCNRNCIDDSLEPDTNGDGVIDDCDCNLNGTLDILENNTDGDLFINACDNCPTVTNPDQVDADNDTFGAACDCDDNEANANPGLTESLADGNCADGIDNDCDGNTDAADPDC